jgi:hypothetical protein
MLKYAKATYEEVVEILGSDSIQGLDFIRVEGLQKQNGPNKLEIDEKVMLSSKISEERINYPQFFSF